MQRKPTPAMIEAAANLIAARVVVQTLTPIVKGIQADLLTRLQIKDEDGQPITDPKNSWLMADHFTATFYPALDAAYQAAGFTVVTGYCPLLIAQSDEGKAVKELNAACMPLVPAHIRATFENMHNPDKIRELAELHLSFLTQFIKA